MKRSPAAAFWLSIIPGAGYVYLGQALKGLTVLLLFASAVHVADRGADSFGLVGVLLVIFSMVDAHRTAVEMNHLLETGRALPRRSQALQFGKWWGWVLIALGLFFTLDNFGWFDLDWVFDLWPLALIAMGVYLLKRPNAPADASSEPPLPPSTEPADVSEPSGDVGAGDDLAMNLDTDSETDPSNA